MENMECAVKLITWNCKGLNGAMKRGNILTHLQSLGADIIFLQETHLKNNAHRQLHKNWVGHVFHSSFNSKSRGTAIIINKNIPFIVSDVISDSNGRYVILTGEIYCTPIILANVYAPNFDDERFIGSVLASLPNLHTHNLILAGDFNFVMDPVLDRSSNKHHPLSKSAKLLQNFLVSVNIIDVWRHMNPHQRKYSFFSQPHKSFSRIDYFFIDSKLLTAVKYIDYEAIVLSDHAPLRLQLNFPGRRSIKTWRLDNGLLSSESHVEYIRSQIAVYMQTNDSPEVSDSTLWEACKAFIRGQIISYSAQLAKTKSERRKNITEQLTKLDNQYAVLPSPDLMSKRTSLQAEFNLLSTAETTKLIIRSRHNHFEHGEKIGRQLAYQTRISEASRYITEIRTHDGNITKDQFEINQEFKQFYSKLYTTETRVESVTMQDFFDNLKIPSISQEDRQWLEEPITLAEVILAIRNLQRQALMGIHLNSIRRSLRRSHLYS